MTPFLQLQNTSTREVYQLDKSPTVIGRHFDCDLRINATSLSRQHARFQRSGSRIMLEDLGSTNGTYVNDQRILQPTRVGQGDLIRFGNQRYKLIDLCRDPEVDAPAALAEALARYDDYGDHTSNRTMQYSHFAQSMGVLSPPAEVASEPLMKMVLASLGKASFDSKCVPAVFIIKNTNRKGALIQLKLPRGGASEWAIGRSSLADVVLDDPTVSSLHSIISLRDNRWHITNNSSTNGIKINRRRVETSEFNHCDLVSIGRIELIFYLLDSQCG